MGCRCSAVIDQCKTKCGVSSAAFSQRSAIAGTSNEVKISLEGLKLIPVKMENPAGGKADGTPR